MFPSAFSPICEYATAVALLTFALKRLWAIDLELRAHRERQRARFHEARGKAREAAIGDPADWRLGCRSSEKTSRCRTADR
jgi:hypothetical protein